MDCYTPLMTSETIHNKAYFHFIYGYILLSDIQKQYLCIGYLQIRHEVSDSIRYGIPSAENNAHGISYFICVFIPTIVFSNIIGVYRRFVFSFRYFTSARHHICAVLLLILLLIVKNLFCNASSRSRPIVVGWHSVLNSGFRDLCRRRYII